MNKNLKKNVLVIFGGRSCEHDISIITGVLTLNSLDREKYNPLPMYITDNACFTGDRLFDLSFYAERTTEGLTPVTLLAGSRSLYSVRKEKLKAVADIYCAVNCCHGLNGEDGSIAGLINLCGIPFASPDMLASSVCMDKAATKTFLEGAGVQTLPYRVLTKAAYFQNRELAVSLTERKIGYPMIVKPSRLGSSIGIKRSSDRLSLNEAIEYAFRYDSKIIVEKALTDFTEINCAAYRCGGRINVSECENPVSAGDMLSFADKYESGLKRTPTRNFPANIPNELSNKIKEITGHVYRKLFAVGIIRIDYLVKDGEIYLNEINTVPGSLAMYLFKNKTQEFSALLTELVEEGVRARRDYDNGTFTYKSNVLNGGGSKIKGSKHSTTLN